MPTAPVRERFPLSPFPSGWFRVASSDKVPNDAFVRVEYRGAWFYIEDSDLNTKSTFNLLDQLFQLQSGSIRRAGPVLTLPLN